MVTINACGKVRNRLTRIDFDGYTPEEIIENLSNLISKYKEYENLEIVGDQSWDSELYEYVPIYLLYGSRDPTEEELAKMRRDEKIINERTEKEERATLARLKQKYEALDLPE